MQFSTFGIMAMILYRICALFYRGESKYKRELLNIFLIELIVNRNSCTCDHTCVLPVTLTDFLPYNWILCIIVTVSVSSTHCYVIFTPLLSCHPQARRSVEQQVADQRRQMDRRFTEKVAELRRQFDTEKQRAVEETKKKQWCANCGKEALFFCCWNTSYCDYPCQVSSCI